MPRRPATGGELDSVRRLVRGRARTGCRCRGDQIQLERDAVGDSFRELPLHDARRRRRTPALDDVTESPTRRPKRTRVSTRRSRPSSSRRRASRIDVPRGLNCVPARSRTSSVSPRQNPTASRGVELGELGSLASVDKPEPAWLKPRSSAAAQAGTRRARATRRRDARCAGKSSDRRSPTTCWSWTSTA